MAVAGHMHRPDGTSDEVDSQRGRNRHRRPRDATWRRWRRRGERDRVSMRWQLASSLAVDGGCVHGPHGVTPVPTRSLARPLPRARLSGWGSTVSPQHRRGSGRAETRGVTSGRRASSTLERPNSSCWTRGDEDRGLWTEGRERCTQSLSSVRCDRVARGGGDRFDLASDRT